jgi:hypothetical protein
VFLLSPVNSWSESGDQGLDLGELTRGMLFIPSCLGLTGLTGASHRSDQCRVLVGFVLGELPGLCVVGLRCYWLVLSWF